MATNYKVQPWNSSLQYKKFDVVFQDAGIYTYHYATQDSVGQKPASIFNFAITSCVRFEDAVTVYYTLTGNALPLAQGCIVRVTGLTNSTFNTTGMLIDAGSGWAKYTNDGWPESFNATVGAINCDNPAFTTGFMFIPSYSTSLEGTQNVIIARFGDGYSQRQRAGLNSNTQSFQLAFNDRSDRESKAILNYIEDKGGVDPVKLLLPINKLQNNPNLKYTIKNPRLTTTYYDINSISVIADQVFDL